MIIGSHDSMTYLRSERWWMRPFECWARCQSKSIQEQYDKGVRYFDLRIRFDNNGVPYFAHGLMAYDKRVTVYKVLDFLEEMEDVACVRIILETVRSASEYQRKCFYEECIYFRYFYNLPFVFGIKNPWQTDPYPLPFVEIAKHFDRKWEALLTPRWFADEQDYELIKLKDQGFEGIVAMDFV